jgi:hypothetical protein
MWQCVRSLYNNHIIIYPDIYISCDDIIAINNIIYNITGISDDYNVYITDQNNNTHIHPTSAFVQMLNTQNIAYIRNIHNEIIERNKTYSSA